MVFEVGKMTPTSAPLYPAQLLFTLRIARKIIGVDWLAIQLLGEVQQHLCQIDRGLETIRARAVVPLLEPFQLQLQAQILNTQLFSPLLLLFGTLLLLFGTLLLLFGTLPLIVALLEQRAHHRSERFAVTG